MVVSTAANGAPTSQVADLYLDPDPVLLPDGTWLVFMGLRTGTSGPLTYALGTHGRGCAPPAQAWQQEGLHFVVERALPR